MQHTESEHPKIYKSKDLATFEIKLKSMRPTEKASLNSVVTDQQCISERGTIASEQEVEES